jgi:hypothetical protein
MFRHLLWIFFFFVACVELVRSDGHQKGGHPSCLKTAESYVSDYPFAPNGRFCNWYEYLGDEQNRQKMAENSADLLLRIQYAAAEMSLPGIKGATLWYVGGNINCTVARQLIEANSGTFSRMFVFEPVFFDELGKNLREFPIAGVNTTVRGYGLGSEDSSFMVPKLGPSTSAAFASNCAKDSSGCAKFDVKSVEESLAVDKFDKAVDNVLYTNCEGCEVPVMEMLHLIGYLQHFKYIHIGTHAISHELNRGHCANMMRLAKTHVKLYGVQFAQERWALKQLFSDV